MRRLSILMLTLVLAAATAIGCGDGGHHGDHGEHGDHSDAAAEATDGAAEDRYTIRGEITAVDEDPASSRLFLHHEAIPDFRSGGEVIGMDSMTMGFTVASDVSRDELAVGDKVEFEWVLGPDAPAGEIVRIERLDPATELDFGASATSDDPDEAHGHDGHDQDGHDS